MVKKFAFYALFLVVPLSLHGLDEELAQSAGAKVGVLIAHGINRYMQAFTQPRSTIESLDTTDVAIYTGTALVIGAIIYYLCKSKKPQPKPVVVTVVQHSETKPTTPPPAIVQVTPVVQTPLTVVQVPQVIPVIPPIQPEPVIITQQPITVIEEYPVTIVNKPRPIVEEHHWHVFDRPVARPIHTINNTHIHEHHHWTNPKSTITTPKPYEPKQTYTKTTKSVVKETKLTPNIVEKANDYGKTTLPSIFQKSAPKMPVKTTTQQQAPAHKNWGLPLPPEYYDIGF